MAQVSPAQVAVALLRAHTDPQAPQFVSESRVSSHPVPSMPSQSPKPGSHASIAQRSPAQVADALTRAHTDPQPPQLASESRVSSHPVPSMPSQLPKPGLHTPSAHVIEAHTGLAFEARHTVPHAPQSVRVSSEVSQPSSGMPLQSANPASHA
jgi:hypothetical protein